MDFRPDDLEQWFVILSKMQNYFLIALCNREYSTIAIKILKKFFFYRELQEKVIKECLETLISMLQLLY